MKKNPKFILASLALILSITFLCSFGGSITGKWQDDAVRKSTIQFDKKNFTKRTYLLLIPVIYTGSYKTEKGILSMTYEKISLDDGKSWIVVSDYDPNFETTKKSSYAIDKDGNLVIGTQVWTKVK